MKMSTLMFVLSGLGMAASAILVVAAPDAGGAMLGNMGWLASAIGCYVAAELDYKGE